MGGVQEEGLSAEEYYKYRKARGESRHARAMGRGLRSGAVARGIELRVLEVGCGAGFCMAVLARECRGALSLIAGCDPDLELLHYTRDTLRREIDGAPMVVRNAQDSLPFLDGSFDAVYCEGVLHHFSNPGAMLGEMLRVLAPGGTLAVVDLNPASMCARAYALYVRARAAADIASKGQIALMRSIYGALPQRDVLRIFKSLGIECAVKKSLASITYTVTAGKNGGTRR